GWRRGGPVLARPPGRLHRAWRHLRRRRAPLAAVALLVAAGAFGVQKLREIRRRDEALKLFEAGRAAFDNAARFEYVEKADLEEMRSLLEEARKRAEEATALAPDMATIPHLLGRVWALNGRRDLARREWRKAIALDPGFGPPRFELGRSLLVDSYLATLSGRGSEPELEARRARRAE